MKKPKITIYRDEVGGWRWRLQSANGRIIAQGESHGSERHARRAAATTVRTAASHPIIMLAPI